MYCNRCGSTIHDTTKPCPTCGLMATNMMNNNMNNNGYMNNGVNYNVNNQPKRTNGVVTFFIVGVVVIGLFFLSSVISTTFSTIDANNDSGIYNAVNYTLKYDPQTWQKYKSDGDTFVLKNRKVEGVLMALPTEYTLLGNYNLASETDKMYIHSELLKVFKTTSDASYSNIMSSIKMMPGTDYYYMSADFYSSQYNYGGRAYAIMSVDSKAILCLLRADGGANSVEDDVFELFKNLDM